MKRSEAYKLLIKESWKAYKMTYRHIKETYRLSKMAWRKRKDKRR